MIPPAYTFFCYDSSILPEYVTRRQRKSLYMNTLPHWRMDTPFAGIDDPALAHAITTLDDTLTTLTTHYDSHHVQKHDSQVHVEARVVETI